MISLTINGLPVSVEKGTTLLEAANYFGIQVPTLCHMEGLTPYGACRLCVVEIGQEPKSRLVSSCTYPAEEGLSVRTASARVVKARKMVLELLVSSSPQSKTIQDLASAHGVTKQRFRPEHEDCILCGLCVRMCAEQMMSSAIGFVGRGPNRRITTAFDEVSEICRRCGGCMYICPVCMSRCQGPDEEATLCNACLNFSPSCVAVYDDIQCWMPPECGTCVRPEGDYLPATGRLATEES